MLKEGFSCLKKHELNTKCKYSSSAMQKTPFVLLSYLYLLRFFLANPYQGKWYKVFPLMFCNKAIFLAWQALIFICEINHSFKFNYQLYLSIFSIQCRYIFLHIGCHVRASLNSQYFRGQKKSKRWNRKPL